MAKEILEVTVTWAEAGAGEIIPDEQSPDVLNDESLARVCDPSGEARSTAHARLKEPWVSLDILNILPSRGHLSHERDNNELFRDDGCLQGWQDEIVRLAKASVRNPAIDRHATITLLVDVVSLESHYDDWSGVTEWDGPVVESVGLLDYGSLTQGEPERDGKIRL